MKALLLVGSLTASLALATPVTSQGTTTSSSSADSSGSSGVSTSLTYSSAPLNSKFTVPSTNSAAGAVQPFDVVAPGVPEPSSMLLLGTGLLGLSLAARRSRRAS